MQIIKTAGKAQLVHSSHFATWERESRLNLSRESLDDKNALSIKKAMRGKARQGAARQLSKLAHVLERREKSPAGFVVVVHVIHTPHCRFTSLCLPPLLLQLPAAQQRCLSLSFSPSCCHFLPLSVCLSVWQRFSSVVLGTRIRLRHSNADSPIPARSAKMPLFFFFAFYPLPSSPLSLLLLCSG